MAFGNLWTYFAAYEWEGGRWKKITSRGPEQMGFGERSSLKMDGLGVLDANVGSAGYGYYSVWIWKDGRWAEDFSFRSW